MKSDPPTDPPALSINMDRINEVSRRLRGSADPGGFVPEIQDIMKDQLDSVQRMQKMYEEGDEKGLASILRSFIGERGTLIEASKSSNSIVRAPDMDLNMADVRDLDNVPDSQIVQFFQPHLLGGFIEQMQEAVQILENVKSMNSNSSGHGRNLKDDFHSQHANGQPFQFDSTENAPGGATSGHFNFGGQSKFNPWGFVNNNQGSSGKRFRRAMRAKIHQQLPNLSKFIHTGPDAHSRRLEVQEKHQRRLNALAVCQPPCSPDDISCSCGRLTSCIDGMTDYDIAMLFVEGYVVTDPGNDRFATFSVDDITELNLFDADFAITNKINRIRDLASSTDPTDREQCTSLLSELHSACDPFETSCSESNLRSHQVSVDDVCDAVDNPAKLLLTLISDELDGYDSNDGMYGSDNFCSHFSIRSTSLN